MSNDDKDVQQIVNEEQESSVNENHDVYQCEGNYSDIDLGDTPKNNTKTISQAADTKAGYHNINIKGDYSAIGSVASVEETQK